MASCQPESAYAFVIEIYRSHCGIVARERVWLLDLSCNRQEDRWMTCFLLSLTILTIDFPNMNLSITAARGYQWAWRVELNSVQFVIFTILERERKENREWSVNIEVTDIEKLTHLAIARLGKTTLIISAAGVRCTLPSIAVLLGMLIVVALKNTFKLTTRYGRDVPYEAGLVRSFFASSSRLFMSSSIRLRT